MFNTSIRTKHYLFLKKSKTPIDESVLAMFIKQNMSLIKEIFFSHNMACSWSLTRLLNIQELLFVFSPVNHIVTESFIFRICSNMVECLTLPEYSCYSNYINSIIVKSDLLSRVKRFIVDEKITLLSEADYAIEITKIKEAVKKPFIHISRIEETIPVQQAPAELKAIDENAIKGQLCFMGLCFNTDEGSSLNVLLAYKLLEKIYGANESTSIYYPLRQRGQIYTGITSYYLEKGRFFTGVIGAYSVSLHESVKQLILSHNIDESMLQQAKESLYNETKYMAFQYGEMFTLFPYYCKTMHIVNLHKFRTTLDTISLDELRKHIPTVMSTVRVV